MLGLLIIIALIFVLIGTGHLNITCHKYDNFHDLLERDESKAKEVFHIGKEK